MKSIAKALTAGLTTALVVILINQFGMPEETANNIASQIVQALIGGIGVGLATWRVPNR